VTVSTVVRWSGLALLGIVIAAAVSIAASRLASQQIGLDSEPISAGNALAPPQSKGRRSGTHRNPSVSPPTRPTTPAPAAPNPSLSEEVEPSQEHADEESGGGADD
jgi:hypothetical protein